MTAQATNQALKPARSSVSLWYARNERRLLGSLGLIAFLAIWELAPAIGLIDPLFTSSPTRVIQAGIAYVQTPRFTNDVLVSGRAFLGGYGLAIAVGIPVGLLMGWYRKVEGLLDLTVSFLYSMPRVALMPLLVIWFGIGSRPIVALIFLMTVWDILLTTMAGVKASDQALTRVARSFNATDLQLFRTAILPGAVPSIISGLRIALGRALIGVVVGELIVSQAGLGNLIAVAGSTFQTDLVFVGILLIAFMGTVLTSIIRALEQKLDKWRPQVN